MPLTGLINSAGVAGCALRGSALRGIAVSMILRSSKRTKDQTDDGREEPLPLTAAVTHGGVLSRLLTR